MTKSLTNFVDLAVAAAQAVDIGCTTRPDLTKSDFRGGSGEDVLRGSHLPIEVDARIFGLVPVIFGQLPDVPDMNLGWEYVRRYRNQGVVARSHLIPEQSLDLQLWLLGPPGSNDDAEWKAFALAIERDDRVARKLVWLPPAMDAMWSIAFNTFVARTFLARPWSSLGPMNTPQLDRVSGLESLATNLPISLDVTKRWFALAGAEDLEDGPDLVDALIDAWAENAS